MKSTTTKREDINDYIKMDNGIIFHLGQPALLPTTERIDPLITKDNAVKYEITEAKCSEKDY